MTYRAKRFKETSGGTGRFRAAPAVVFLAFIFLMALFFLFSKKANYSTNEKRKRLLQPDHRQQRRRRRLSLQRRLPDQHPGFRKEPTFRKC